MRMGNWRVYVFSERLLVSGIFFEKQKDVFEMIIVHRNSRIRKPVYKVRCPDNVMKTKERFLSMDLVIECPRF